MGAEDMEGTAERAAS